MGERQRKYNMNKKEQKEMQLKYETRKIKTAKNRERKH